MIVNWVYDGEFQHLCFRRRPPGEEPGWVGVCGDKVTGEDSVPPPEIPTDRGCVCAACKDVIKSLKSKIVSLPENLYRPVPRRTAKLKPIEMELLQQAIEPEESPDATVRSEEKVCAWCGKKLRIVHSAKRTPTNRFRPPSTCFWCPREGPYDPPVKTKPSKWELKSKEPPGVWTHKPCGNTTPGKFIYSVTRKAIYEKPGYRGNGFFCSLRCGFKYGVYARKEGKRK